MTSDIANAVQARIAEYVESHPRSNLAQRGGIQRCSEFDRIDALPRRTWTDAEAIELAALLTEWLRLPGGTQTLRPIQAIALYELAENGGIVSPIRVGGGKTHITILAATIMGAYRPMLLMPAKLIPKTERELKIIMRHWRIKIPIVKSYEWLGRVQAARYLESVRPDMLICDEAHRIRNGKAAVTRRVKRYVEKYSPRFVALSGTLIRKRLLDWAHMADGALGNRSPVPRKYTTLVHWGTALDHGGTASPGVLSAWQTGDEPIRDAYQRRVRETPGIVATSEGLLGVSLTIEAWRSELPVALKDALEQLGRDWTLPDGQAIAIDDPLGYYRAARTLALGCYYRYVVPPPPAWLEARRAWGQFVRHACRHLRDKDGRPVDTAFHVETEIRNGRLQDDGSLAAWANLRHTFKPQTEHIWVDDTMVQRAIALAIEHCAIVWVEAIAVGQRMHKLGLTYYGAQGKSPDGRSILDAPHGTPFAASIKSAGEGQNLQPWANAIFVSPPSDGGTWEQAIGRIHRDGQEADECAVKVALFSEAHEESWLKALDHTRYLEAISGQAYKLLQATLVDMPEEK